MLLCFVVAELIKTSQEYLPRAHFTTPDATVPFTTSVTLRVEGQYSFRFADMAYISWYYNGGSLPLSVSDGTMIKIQGGFLQILTIEKAGIQHSGIYQAVLWIDPYSYLLQFNCPREYANFITSTSRISSPIILDVVTFDLKYQGKNFINQVMFVCQNQLLTQPL